MIQSFDCEACTSEFSIEYDDMLNDLTATHCIFCGEFLIHDDDRGVIRARSLDDDDESVDL